MTLGEQIRAFREEAGLTMGQASRRAGIGSGHWSNVENDNVRQPSIFVVAKMAKALDARLDDLMYGVPLPDPDDAGWTARRAREGNTRQEIEEFCRLRKEFRTRDVAEVFGRSSASAHMMKMRQEGVIEPLDPDLPQSSPNWRYRWVG